VHDPGIGRAVAQHVVDTLGPQDSAAKIKKLADASGDQALDGARGEHTAGPRRRGHIRHSGGQLRGEALIGGGAVRATEQQIPHPRGRRLGCPQLGAVAARSRRLSTSATEAGWPTSTAR
jgi:hypothetical protein